MKCNKKSSDHHSFGSACSKHSRVSVWSATALLAKMIKTEPPGANRYCSADW